MKRNTILFLFMLSIFDLSIGQTMHKAYIDYIAKYADIAVEQQKLHKIPASVKLAQGLLESAGGHSELARVSNNHFGIKCGNWTGEQVYADDDRAGECFRKYSSVRDSYEDHSRFLSVRSRYASLFKLEPTDYKGWSNGLKSAGYATDPNYARKLIKLIEDYDLHKYDLGQEVDMTIADSQKNAELYTWETLFDTTLKGHELFRNNGVMCVFAQAGDTYVGIATEFEIDEKKILQYNDLEASRPLEPGTVVYLASKKRKAEAKFPIHTVVDGESLYRIAQKYAVRLQSLYDLNLIPYDQSATVGMMLKLR